MVGFILLGSLEVEHGQAVVCPLERGPEVVAWVLEFFCDLRAIPEESLSPLAFEIGLVQRVGDELPDGAAPVDFLVIYAPSCRALGGTNGEQRVAHHALVDESIEGLLLGHHISSLFLLRLDDVVWVSGWTIGEITYLLLLPAWLAVPDVGALESFAGWALIESVSTTDQLHLASVWLAAVVGGGSGNHAARRACGVAGRGHERRASGPQRHSSGRHRAGGAAALPPAAPAPGPLDHTSHVVRVHPWWFDLAHGHEGLELMAYNVQLLRAATPTEAIGPVESLLAAAAHHLTVAWIVIDFSHLSAPA